MRKTPCLAALLTLFLAASARAYIFQPTPVPDALTRAAAWIKDHPARPEGYFFLGHINGSAWAKGTTGKDAEVSIATFGDAQTAPFFVPWDSLMYQRRADADVTAESKTFLLASLLNYRQAVALDEKNPLYHLGLAWACEQAASCRLELPLEAAGATALAPDRPNQVDAAIAQLADADFSVRDKAAQSLTAAMPAAAKTLLAVQSQDPEVTARIDSILRGYWLAQAAAHYRQAYSLSVADDLKADQFRDEADHTVSVVAGKRLLILLPAQSDVKAQEIKDIQAALLQIDAKPRAAIFY